LQLSDATALAYVTTASHSPARVETVMLAGHVIDGASLSITVTLNLQSDSKSAVSRAMYSTFVTPIGNTDPLSFPRCLHKDDPGQLSDCEIEYVTWAPQIPNSVLVVMSAGQDIDGVSPSWTVTEKVQRAELRAPSSAANETDWLPTVTNELEAGPLDLETVARQLSVTEASV